MARIIHFGEDSCHRIKVLEGAGYSVQRCASIEDIGFYLRSYDCPDAVVISDEFGKATRLAVHLAKVEWAAPVILFEGTENQGAESAFDLIIPPLTDPSNWLSKIEETIQRSRELHHHHDMRNYSHRQHHAEVH